METSFGNWVRRRRKALDLTQDELAHRVGFSLSAIYKIEADERRPSRQVAELLATHLEIAPDQRELFLKVARQQKSPESLEAVSPPASRLPAAVSIQPPHGLPVFPTPFVGREHEMDIVVKQLLDPTCRLLTLTGPGGVGKTRLAIEVARRLETAFTDGVVFLSMAAVSQPESIIPSVAGWLGLVFSGPADPLVQVINALRGRTILLVLDNMEHLVAGSGILSEILQQAPGVKLLLTSREQVYLQWEWLFEVQGLPIPEEATANALESNSAAILFLNRARQASQEFILTPEEAGALVQICRLVDGLPLAIELAASWVRSLSFGEIARELERDVDLLQTAMHDIPARHRSMRVVFDQSWSLMTEDERSALMKLSVFAGGFTRQAAEAVAGASYLLLSALVSKSLLHYHKKTGRYDFHELIRQYSSARLQAWPEEAGQSLARQAEYHAGWVSQMEIALKSVRQTETAEQIRAETANWMSAWRWAVQNCRADLLRQMIPCLSWYFEVNGYYEQALTLTGYATDQLRASGAPGCLEGPLGRSVFASLIDQTGWFLFRTGDSQQAAALFAESLELAREAQDPETLFYIHNNWSYQALINGELDKARQMALESLDDAQRLQSQRLRSQWHIAVAATVLGIVEYQLSNMAGAYQMLSESLETWRAVGDPRGTTFCMLYLGAAALASDDNDTAEGILCESNTLAAQVKDRWALSFGLDLLGQSAVARGDSASARGLFEQSLALSKEIGDKWAVTLSMIHLGDVYAALEAYGEARRLFREAFMNAQQASWTPTMLEALVAFASIDEATGPESRLAVAMSVLAHPAVVPTVRQRAGRLRDSMARALSPGQVEEARLRAAAVIPEQWAQVIFKDAATVGHHSAYR